MKDPSALMPLGSPGAKGLRTLTVEKMSVTVRFTRDALRVSRPPRNTLPASHRQLVGSQPLYVSAARVEARIPACSSGDRAPRNCSSSPARPRKPGTPT